MQFQFDVSTFVQPKATEAPAPPSSESIDLLRQLLEVQRHQLSMMQAAAAAHDTTSRWRAFLGRWREDFPNLAESCKEVLPTLERAYGTMLADLAERLQQEGPDALDNDFALQEFLDRFGMRLAQFGTILSLVGPLAEAAPPPSDESSSPSS